MTDTDSHVTAYCDRIATMTADELFSLGGERLRECLESLMPAIEPFDGDVQTVAHAILLGELFAMMDESLVLDGIHLYTFEHRLQAFVAQIRRAYTLSHETRNRLAPTKTN